MAKVEVLARLQLNRVPTWSARERHAVQIWLRQQADRLKYSHELIAPTYRARYNRVL